MATSVENVFKLLDDRRSRQSIGVTYSRTMPLPLDRDSLFRSFDELSSYALTSLVAYPGQLLAVVDEDDVNYYKVNPDGSVSRIDNTTVAKDGIKKEVIDGVVTYSGDIAVKNFSSHPAQIVDKIGISSDGSLSVEFRDLTSDVLSGTLQIDGNFVQLSGYHREGSGTVAEEFATHAEGLSTCAAQSGSHAEGFQTSAFGYCSSAKGMNALALGSYSHAEGLSSRAYGIGAHTEGFSSFATGYYAHAEGYYSRAMMQSTHAEGISSTASGEGSHSEGESTSSLGYVSHAEGIETCAGGRGSHTEGKGTTAGDFSHAEGEETGANGYGSHAEGLRTYAYGSFSHAEGIYSTSHGLGSHAEGTGAIAIGKGSHAEGGNQVYAISECAHASGFEKSYAGTYLFDVKGVDDATNVITCNSVSGLSVGDYIAFCNSANTTLSSIFNTRILSIISDTEISVNNLPFKSSVLASNAFIFCPTKPLCGTRTGGQGAYVEGSENFAYTYSHAEGLRNFATGKFSHCQGIANRTGWGATAIGRGNDALGWNSIAMGGNGPGDSASTDYGTNSKVLASGAFSWSGTTSCYVVPEDRVGTFNVDPMNGLSGFYIGDQNLCSVISDEVAVVQNDVSEVSGVLSGVAEALKTDSILSGKISNTAEMSTIISAVVLIFSKLSAL